MLTITPQLAPLPQLTQLTQLAQTTQLQLAPLPQRGLRAQHETKCPCEECLSNRIRLTAAMATPEQPLVPLGVRQRRYRVRLATDGMQRRVS